MDFRRGECKVILVEGWAVTVTITAQPSRTTLGECAYFIEKPDISNPNLI